MLRTEEWEYEYKFPTPEPVLDPDTGEVLEQPSAPPSLINQLVLAVWEGDVVRVPPEAVEPYGFDGTLSKEVVPEGQQRFVREFKYSDVAESLTDNGWNHVSTTEN